MSPSKATMSIEQYLETSFEDRDHDFVDGEVEERALPDRNHAAWQLAIQSWFVSNQKKWNIRVRPDLRIRASATRVRVPDVSIFDQGQPIEPIDHVPIHAPLAVIEILSPDDKYANLLRRLFDYQTLGVAQIWVVNPKAKSWSRFVDGQLIPEDVFDLPQKHIRFSMDEIYMTHE